MAPDACPVKRHARPGAILTGVGDAVGYKGVSAFGGGPPPNVWFDVPKPPPVRVFFESEVRPCHDPVPAPSAS